MKKITVLLILFFLIIIVVVSVNLINLQAEQNVIKSQNRKYEDYLNKQILGTELATLINKVVEQNEQNKIEKDNNNYYIDNGTNSLKLYLKMSTIEKTYAMEEIYNNNTSSFVQHFNLIDFKCTNIEYHKTTGRVSKIIFEEIIEDTF